MIPSIETERLTLRPLTEEDAGFIVELLNEPAFIENIGDRKVRTEADAIGYLRAGPIGVYAKQGYGIYAVVPHGAARPVGICGLVSRDTLPGPDLGFAFLAAHRRRGYAYESSRAVLQDAAVRLRFAEVYAIVLPENLPSVALLERLGFRSTGTVEMHGDRLSLMAYRPPDATAKAKDGA